VRSAAKNETNGKTNQKPTETQDTIDKK